MRYRIRGISVWAAAQTGFVFGLLIGALPSLINVLLVQIFAHNYYALIHKTDIDIVPGFNLADKLGLREAITAADKFDEGLTYVLIFFGGIAFAGLILGGLAALSAWVYNRLYSRFGGLDVTLEPITPAAASPVQPVPMGAANRSGVAQPSAPMPPLPQPVPPSTLVAASPIAAPVSHAPQAVSAAGPRLCLSHNPSQVWLIAKLPYLIGSGAGNDFYTQSLQPQHARIDYDAAAHGYVLTDLSNGQTWVNERPVLGKNKLNSGFRVRFGSVDLLFYA